MMGTGKNGFIGLIRAGLIAYLVLLILFGHLLILLLAHSAILAITEKITLDAALTPLHEAFMADAYMQSYEYLRETVFAEIPYYSLLRGIFGSKMQVSWQSLFFDTVKAVVSGMVCYILCRFNRFLSSKRNPIVFGIVTSFWTSISVFSALCLVVWLQTLPAKQGILISVILLLVLPAMVSLFSYCSLRHDGMPLRFSRILEVNVRGLLYGVLDSLVYYILSCVIFDLLHPLITDEFSLLMVVLFLSVIALYGYNYLKSNKMS